MASKSIIIAALFVCFVCALHTSDAANIRRLRIRVSEEAPVQQTQAPVQPAQQPAASAAPVSSGPAPPAAAPAPAPTNSAAAPVASSAAKPTTNAAANGVPTSTSSHTTSSTVQQSASVAGSSQPVSGSVHSSQSAAGSTSVVSGSSSQGSAVTSSQQTSSHQVSSQQGSSSQQHSSSSGSSSGSSVSSSSSSSNSSQSSSSHSSSSQSSSPQPCVAPTTCSYSVTTHEKVDPDLSPLIPRDQKKKSDDGGLTQGELKPIPKESLVELDSNDIDIIEATPVVALEIIADTKEENKDKFPSLDTHFQLKTSASQVDYDLGFDKKMGLAPTMSVSTTLIKRAEKMIPIADRRHYEFQERHEFNCRPFSMCPKEGAAT